ncbi:hypothetical protein [Sphingomonas sp.]|jgi:hypothetical protein|uniref:hypothetical protein n=1 Tax=Sphingomonas sp. TaxID=28214 RepID=UPI002D806DF4|nr:hypothetical protein [Sphingomonas sp.]HEU0045591.1 hypothetical protein [Sphingomonas sp.]
MAEYRNNEAGDRVYVEKRGGAGRVIGIVALLAGLIAALLFLTGFWRVNATGGEMPKVEVDAKAGALPNVDVDSKSVVVGTKQETVEVPKVTTEKETVSVPTIGVSEGETDKK